MRGAQLGPNDPIGLRPALVRHNIMIKDNIYNKRGNPLPHFNVYIPRPLFIPLINHWLEREIT